MKVDRAEKKKSRTLAISEDDDEVIEVKPQALKEALVYKPPPTHASITT